MQTKPLLVEKVILRIINQQCTKQKDHDYQGETIFDEDVKFDDGMIMVIQAIDCVDEPAWTQGVLFDDGCEIGCTEVKETLDGIYIVDDYTVIVKPYA